MHVMESGLASHMCRVMICKLPYISFRDDNHMLDHCKWWQDAVSHCAVIAVLSKHLAILILTVAKTCVD